MDLSLQVIFARVCQDGETGYGRRRMLNPNTAITGRITLFVEVDVFDHDVGVWNVWSSTHDSEAADVNALLQEAIDAGFDDVRASVHNTGSRRS